MPFLKRIAQEGLFRKVQGVFPSVTNVNNVSICCGSWPDKHGISANSYFDPATGRVDYMNSAELITTQTLFQRASQWGMASALLTSKRKTAELFRNGTAVNIAAEAATPEQVKRYGQPPSIYSREINYWLWQAAIDILENRPDIDLIYVHTTDYPMHAWAEEEPESQAHLSEIDKLIHAATETAPDVAFLFTADHGMNKKQRCWDLSKACARAGVPVRFVLSPERDYYVQHHRNFTGCAWVWLQSASDEQRVRDVISGLAGVEEVHGAKRRRAAFPRPPRPLGRSRGAWGSPHNVRRAGERGRGRTTGLLPCPRIAVRDGCAAHCAQLPAPHAVRRLLSAQLRCDAIPSPSLAGQR